eukprot:275845-Pyramimonas_sp.AAC.1
MHAGGSRGYGPGASRGGSRYSCAPVLSAKGRHSPTPVRAPSTLNPERRLPRPWAHAGSCRGFEHETSRGSS